MRSGKFAKFLGLISSISYWSNYANSTRSENGRQRRACKWKGTDIPALGADVILCDGLLFTFASQNVFAFFRVPTQVPYSMGEFNWSTTKRHGNRSRGSSLGGDKRHPEKRLRSKAINIRLVPVKCEC